MLRRSDLVDLYSLADPAKCKQYVILSAKAIGKLFTEVNLTPREQGGSLYIQSIEGLKRFSGDQEALHYENCTKIAFFFIRIFQTFGALLLSVINDTVPETDPAAPLATRHDNPRYQKAFDAPLPFARAPARAWRPYGGALSRARDPTFLIPDGSPFSILNDYLNAPRAGATSKDAMSMTGVSSLFILQRGLYTFDAADARTPADPIDPVVTYAFREGDAPIQTSAHLGIEQNDTKYTVTLRTILIDGESLGGKEVSRILTDFHSTRQPTLNGKELPAVLASMFKDLIVEQKGFSIVQFLFDKGYISSTNEPTNIAGTSIKILNPAGDYRTNPLPIVYTDSVPIDNRTEKISIKAGLVVTKSAPRSYAVGIDFSTMKVAPDYMRQVIDVRGMGVQKQFTAGSDSSDPLNDKGEKIPAYLKRRFDILLKPAKSGRAEVGKRYTREGLPKPYVLSGAPDFMRVDGLWKALIQTPPVKAHCSARAMQLLNVAAIRGDTTSAAFSNICNTRFQLVVDHSLPGLGKPIVEEYGIGAMASLFVDGLQKNMPLISNADTYRQFLKQLNKAFIGFKTLEDTPQPEKMEQIVDQSLSKLCVGQGAIPLDTTRRYQVRSVALKLLARQKQHYSRVMTLIYRLFDGNKVKAGAFEINPAVMAGGIEAVNRIAVDARELLIKYYEECEDTYKQGVLLVQQQERGKTATPLPVSSAPVEEDENADEDEEEETI